MNPLALELIAKNIGISVSTLKRLFLDATEQFSG
jgi:AraC-like DNA-binding protein